jgi:hypothetical protein
MQIYEVASLIKNLGALAIYPLVEIWEFLVKDVLL